MAQQPDQITDSDDSASWEDFGFSLRGANVSDGEFWLTGECVLYACPDCDAPLTVHLWLMVADCWQCGTSIELSEEQERAVDRLLEEQASNKSNRSRPVAGRTQTPAARQPIIQSVDPAPQADPAAKLPANSQAQAPPRQLAPTFSYGELTFGNSNWLRDLPAWLASLIMHLLVLMLLALLVMEREREEPTITLSMAVSKYRQEGDRLAKLVSEVRFDLPAPDDRQPHNAEDIAALVRADQEARPLRIDPDSTDPNLLALNRVKAIIQSRDDLGRPLATRDPRLRRELIFQEGGTSLTEAAVARGLHWLATQQNPLGSWALAGRRQRSAGTSLALLPFLGAGQTHLVGHYKDTVSGGLRYLLESQKPDGDLRGDAARQYGMYVHGQAAIVLCEAYAMTHDESLREPAQQAIDFIVAAQYPLGGWRYQPRHELRNRARRGDTSVLGWQVMALQSARAAGLEVPNHALELAHQFLDLVGSDDGATYAYQQGGGPTPTMTAEGLLCRMYLGWQRQEPALDAGLDYLMDRLPAPGQADYYYWYYATQVVHHVGGRRWERWNREIRNTLVDTQRTRGRDAGSWPARGHHNVGELYSTSLAICTLEVYYRHAPIFRRIIFD